MYQRSLKEISQVNVIAVSFGQLIIFYCHIKFLAQRNKLRQCVAYSGGYMI